MRSFVLSGTFLMLAALLFSLMLMVVMLADITAQGQAISEVADKSHTQHLAADLCELNGQKWDDNAGHCVDVSRATVTLTSPITGGVVIAATPPEDPNPDPSVNVTELSVAEQKELKAAQKALAAMENKIKASHDLSSSMCWSVTSTFLGKYIVSQRTYLCASTLLMK